MNEKIKTKSITENTISIDVEIYNSKGTIALLNSFAASATKYLMEKDSALLYIEMIKERRDIMRFVFKENDFQQNKEKYLVFLKNMMNELWDLNVKSSITEKNLAEKIKTILNFVQEKPTSIKKNRP